MLRVLLPVVVLSALAAGHVRAQGARGERVAVLLLASPDVDPTVADALSETLIGAVAARGGVTLIGQTELRAQLGHDDAQLLACVNAPSCLERVGAELGLREVIAGTLGRRRGGEAWVFSLARVDVETGRQARALTREVDGDLGALADALTDAVGALYEEERPEPIEPLPEPPARGTLIVESHRGAEVQVDDVLAGVVGEGPLQVDGLAPGPHRVRVSARNAVEPWDRSIAIEGGAARHVRVELEARASETISPLFWIASSAAVMSLGVAIGLGVHSQGELDLTQAQRLGGEVTRAEAVAFYDARFAEAVTADVLFGLAAAAAITAAIALFFPDRQPLEIGGRF